MSYGVKTPAQVFSEVEGTVEVSLEESAGSNQPPSVPPPSSIPSVQPPVADRSWNSRPTPPNSLPGIVPATASVSLTSPASPSNQNNSRSAASSAAAGGSVQERLDSIKAWSISTYKCSRQLISEKLGKTSRTVDSELDGQIERLRETQKKYLNILKLARALSSHLYNMISTQLTLSEQFSELGQRSAELQQEFAFNANSQRTLHQHGNLLLSALNLFVSSVNTLCNKTMDDTLVTVRQYESARVEYDAYRADLEWMRQCGEYSDSGGAASSRAAEAKRQLDQRRALYDQLRSDVIIKLRFLDENRVKVMHKQLLLFHNAVCTYFSGNQQALQESLRQFNIHTPSATSSLSSFLENTTIDANNAAQLNTPAK